MTALTSGVPRRLVPLLAGAAAILAGVAVGTNPRVLDALLDAPILVRAPLAALGGLAGLWFVGIALARLAEGHDSSRPGRPFGEMVRAVRFIFLGVAAFAAGAAFLVAHPLPLVVALIVAGIDVVETALLLLVGGRRRDDAPPA